MNPIVQWMRNHPFKLTLYVTGWAITATTAGWRPDLARAMAVIYGAIVLMWLGTYLWDIRKLLALLLVATVIPVPAKTEEQPNAQAAWGGVAVVVVCVGGYCVYKMVKLCQKKFPKEDTNSPPQEVTGLSSNDEYGGSYNFGSIGSCYDGDGNGLTGTPDSPPFIANIKVTVDEFGGVKSDITASQDNGSHSQTWAEFQAEVASHGLWVSGQADNTQYFERGGIPCDSAALPFSFDQQTHAIVHHGTEGRTRTITIERSADMQQWGLLVTVTSTFDAGFQVVDLTRQGQMFYRVSVQ